MRSSSSPIPSNWLHHFVEGVADLAGNTCPIQRKADREVSLPKRRQRREQRCRIDLGSRRSLESHHEACSDFAGDVRRRSNVASCETTWRFLINLALSLRGGFLNPLAMSRVARRETTLKLGPSQQSSNENWELRRPIMQHAVPVPPPRPELRPSRDLKRAEHRISVSFGAIQAISPMNADAAKGNNEFEQTPCRPFRNNLRCISGTSICCRRAGGREVEAMASIRSQSLSPAVFASKKAIQT